jgi:hypothetical protein
MIGAHAAFFVIGDVDTVQIIGHKRSIQCQDRSASP